MKRKEFPMPDDHKKLMADLLELVARRDKCAADLKYAAPELREKLRKEIARADKLIERGEATLARDYEEHQKNCRNDEEWEATMRKMERFYVYVMYRRPEMFSEVATSILRYVYNVAKDGEGFHDRIEILIATQLDEILDDKNLDQFDF